MRHFTRTPFYSGPDDPEMGQVRGKLALSDWPLQLVVVASSQVTGAGDRLRPRRWRKQML